MGSSLTWGGVDDDEKTTRFTEYSMSSSVIPRSEGALCEK